MFRMKIVATTLIAACVLASPLGAVPAPHVTWKLPTVAPTGSLWHKALTDMAAAWTRDTGGRVGATVFPNSALGGEAAVVRNMRSGQIEASLLMLSGLGLVDDGFNALGIPFFFKDDAEARAVQDAVTPLLEKRITAKGFHLLAWTNGGWVQLFSTTQLKTLADIKKAKLWTSDGDAKMVQWYKTNGFNPVAMDAKDVAPALKVGTINATPSPAFGASVLNLYRDAPFMLDIHVGPLLGAIVVTTTAWNAISADDQAKVTAAAKAFERSTSADVPAKDLSSVGEMQKRGLTVTKMAPADSAVLYAEIDKLVASMRGDMVPADMFDAVKNARDAYRAKGKAPAGTTSR
jgi:TRAP-type C4-dicarboxylate transport system substrate-binding protein